MLAEFHIGKGGGLTIAMLDSLRITKAFLTTEGLGLQLAVVSGWVLNNMVYSDVY